MKINYLIFILLSTLILYTSCTSKSKRRQEIADNNNNVVNPRVKKDKTGPIINIFSPKTNSRGLVVVKITENIIVSGQATDKSGVKEISINNISVNFNGNGNFNKSIQYPRNRRIKITAIDNKNNTSTILINLTAKDSPVNVKNQQKFALVIGNEEYSNATNLRNPVNDANAISSTLKQLGFKVYKYTNLTQTELIRKIDNFGDRLTENSVSLFYYAGHGLQVGRINYLVPTNSHPKSEQDIEYQCVKAGRILAKMKNAKTAVNILILDACRDNPFERSWNRGSKTQGLATMTAPAGTIISFSADANQTAGDGIGNHGLFTEELLKNMVIPNLEIEEVFKRTRISVMRKSGNKQEPAEYNKMTGDFYFSISR